MNNDQLKSDMVMDFGSKEDVERLNALEEQIRKNPNDIEALIEKGFLCLMIFEGPNDAQPYLEKAVKLEPRNTEALFWLAKVHYHRGDNRTAKKWLEHTLRIDPNRADCHDLLATVLDELGKDLEKAKFHWKKTIELEPTWVFARTGLISQIIREGDLDLAEQMAFEGIKIINESQLPEPTIDMERYREGYITGRTSSAKWRFNILLEEIEKRRAELTNK